MPFSNSKVKLASIEVEVKYYYNEDGIRVRKVVGDHVVEYHLEGKEVVYETRGSDTLYYIRDEANGLIGIVFNGNKYYYKKNNQRDIIGIYDSNYNLVVEYQYDVYGKVISIKDKTGKEITDSNHIGKINPIRYRSYYYDDESGYYYLNSRYYNPEWGRFLNADGIIGTSSNIDTYNLYSYVENNFVNKFDENGNFAIPLVYVGYYALGMLAAYTAAKLAPEAIRTSVAVAGSIRDVLIDALTKNGSNDGENNKQNDKYCVYMLYENTPEMGNVKYIGRTNNLERRKNEHQRNPYRAHLNFSKIECYPTKEEARINEQVYIDIYNTLQRDKNNPIQNQRNGVNKNSKFFIEKVMSYIPGLYYEETYVGGNEWD